MGNSSSSKKYQTKWQKDSLMGKTEPMVNCIICKDRDTPFDTKAGSLENINGIIYEEMNQKSGDVPSKIPILKNPCTTNNGLSNRSRNNSKTTTARRRSQSGRTFSRQASPGRKRFDSIVSTRSCKKINKIIKNDENVNFDRVDICARRTVRGDKRRNHIKENITNVTNQNAYRKKIDSDIIIENIPKTGRKVEFKNVSINVKHNLSNLLKYDYQSEDESRLEDDQRSDNEKVSENDVKCDLDKSSQITPLANPNPIKETFPDIVINRGYKTGHKNIEERFSDGFKNKILEVIAPIHSTNAPKISNSGNTVKKLRRPQSLSGEAEHLNRRQRIKSTSNVSAILADSSFIPEYSAVIQDVSSLKLMLYKLKRYLSRDGDERLLDITNECLYRLSSRPTIDIAALSRQELEQKYEGLLDKNGNLERLLESRENVIAKLQSDKRMFEQIVHSSLTERHEPMTRARPSAQVPLSLA